MCVCAHARTCVLVCVSVVANPKTTERIRRYILTHTLMEILKNIYNVSK